MVSLLSWNCFCCSEHSGQGLYSLASRLLLNLNCCLPITLVGLQSFPMLPDIKRSEITILLLQ